MRSRRLFALGILAILPRLVSVFAQSDQKVVTPEAFFQKVYEHHPAARQAALLPEQAQANLLAAKGGFDPKLTGDWQRKNFGGSTYFNIGEGSLKIPSWFGLEGKIGYNYASGDYLNSENKLPAEGQGILGLTASLGHGLLLDERRAGLFTAKNEVQIKELEARLALNDLYLEAAKIYWDWALAKAWRDVFYQATTIAQQRFEGIRTSWQQGDRAAIDTLEAFIQVQDRQLEFTQSELFFQNATFRIQNFLWQDEYPEKLWPDAVPVSLEQPLSITGFQPFVAPDSLVNYHPATKVYTLKINQLKIERRLKAEQLKPQFDLSYNLLAEKLDFNPASNDLLRDNFKWEAVVAFPLFLRKERGAEKLTRLKILDANYDLSLKRQELATKISIYQNELTNLQQQIIAAAQLRLNYERLLQAETEKFRLGESSFFLINSRENKLIEADLKLAKLRAEFAKMNAALRWAAGRGF